MLFPLPGVFLSPLHLSPPNQLFATLQETQAFFPQASPHDSLLQLPPNTAHSTSHNYN